MLSQKIVAFGQPLQAVEEDTPTPKGTEVLVKVTAAGVCHSDVHLWEGFFDLGEGQRIDVGARGLKLPHVLGHEVAGKVVALGPQASGVETGKSYVVFPWIGCGECDACAAGDENYCPAPRYIGVRRDGGYADHVIVPHARYLVDFGGVPDDLACTYACSGITTYSALSKALPLGAKDSLLIIGAGGLGLMALEIARARTDARIIVADIDEEKMTTAKRCGAEHVVNPKAAGALQQVIDWSDGGVAAAMDVVGAPTSARFGFDALRRTGKLIVVGLFGGSLSVPLPLLPMRSVTIQGSYVGNLQELRDLAALVATGKVQPIPVTPKPLDYASTALAALRDGKVVGRVVLTP